MDSLQTICCHRVCSLKLKMYRLFSAGVLRRTPIGVLDPLVGGKAGADLPMHCSLIHCERGPVSPAAPRSPKGVRTVLRMRDLRIWCRWCSRQVATFIPAGQRPVRQTRRAFLYRDAGVPHGVGLHGVVSRVIDLRPRPHRVVRHHSRIASSPTTRSCLSLLRSPAVRDVVTCFDCDQLIAVGVMYKLRSLANVTAAHQTNSVNSGQN